MLPEQLTPKELVYKHIFDLSHIVTEEELQNMQVGFRYLEGEELETTQVLRQRYPHDDR